MNKRKTTAQFIQDARKIHGQKYDYSLVLYVNAREKVKIFCPDHGIFDQTPNSHLNGQGCILCGIDRRSKKRALGLSGFVEKALATHGEKMYDYSRVDYCSNHKKVKIICPSHGEFLQTPHDHLQGAGCPLCASEARSKIKRNTKNQFIQSAKAIHGEKYSYLLTEYVNSKAKIKITCPDHGVFLQRPNCHLNGRGCPECADHGFNHQKQALLYFVLVESKTDCFWKIGITNTTIEKRFSEHKLIQRRFEWLISDGWKAKKIEKMVLQSFDAYRLPPDPKRLKRGGFTECFRCSIPWSDVVKLIESQAIA